MNDYWLNAGRFNNNCVISNRTEVLWDDKNIKYHREGEAPAEPRR